MRRIERFPVILMALRLLDWGARYDPKIKTSRDPDKAIRNCSGSTCLVNCFLIAAKRQVQSSMDLAVKAEQLAEKLEEDYPECAQMLRNAQSQPNPVWRLAESLTSLTRPKEYARQCHFIVRLRFAHRPTERAWH